MTTSESSNQPEPSPDGSEPGQSPSDCGEPGSDPGQSTSRHPDENNHHGHSHGTGWGIVLVALGVVFGDIGTSPLYALKECFAVHAAHPDRTLPATAANVHGVLSLIIWSLLIIVTIKYVIYVLKADRDGEGGILSLLVLATQKPAAALKKSRAGLVMLGVFGAALLYGDGMITPAITTLSAIEGLNVATDTFQHWILPLTITVIIVLFSVQYMGTDKVGRFFGPVTLVWFLALAALGINSICGMSRPAVLLEVFNPLRGLDFLLHAGFRGFVVMGSVFLVVTGAEALYADLGHFGRPPIARAWMIIVLPALVLNYLGQGAYLLENPGASSAPGFSPFFQMAPRWSVVPMVLLATAAAAIASQALITGIFSLTMQAIQLGYLPRMGIRHTSRHRRGQIYIPLVNWLLMLACIGLVLGFRSSTALAAAYGIAVSLTMIVTTLLFYFAAREHWNWPLWKAALLCGGFLALESVFFAANSLKIHDGGWFPLLIGAVFFTIATTWQKGRRLLGEELSKTTIPQEMFIESLQYSKSLVRVPGTAIFLTGSGGRTPVSTLHNLKHNKVLHERVIFLTIVTESTPYISPGKQVELELLAEGFWRLTGHYGFMQEPDVPQLLRRARQHGLEAHCDKVTFFLGRETVVPDATNPGMAPWREHIFAFLSRIAQPPANYFKLPENRVVELGMRVRI